jgi:glycosyltransferase involved in cell wall biosynthesis
MNPRFTILTAVYNAQAYVAECIESVLSQTCGEWQMICIDDCSTDDSKQILHQYAARDSRIQVMQTEVNSGQAVARNVGLQVAQGTFTLMLDADDMLSPDALESAWQAHLQHPEVDTFLFRL